MKKAMQQETKEISKNAYDEVPYSSFTFAQTSPAYTRSCAYVFGLNSPDHTTAKVLELGCASGNNILAFAAAYPKSECVGIDLSPKQIDEGKKRISDLGIKNLRLETKSIMDIDESFGKFDYIICHGVISWVPKEVQAKILEICGNNLTPDGVAYVSYNTMPGWSGVRAIREMMQYHTANFTEPKTKADQSRLLLKFIKDSLKNYGKNYYSDIIEAEMNLLQNQSDWYLLHDHLEENNSQYYFHEFIAMAAKSGLQYLAETNLASMFSGNLPAETAQVLAGAEDIVRIEQYMDFISNRRFRSTLLCHKDRILRRNIQNEHMMNQFFTSSFKLPEELKTYEYGSGKQISFVAPNNMSTSTNNIALILGIETLSENKNKPMNLSKISKIVSEKIKKLKLIERFDDQMITQALAANFLRCIFTGGITIHMSEGPFKIEVSKKPKLFSLARYQVANQSWVANMRHEAIPTNIFDKAIMPHLDGSNTVESLLESLMPKFISGELSINSDNKKITEEKELREKLSNFIPEVLKRYAELGLLEQ